MITGLKMFKMLKMLKIKKKKSNSGHPDGRPHAFRSGHRWSFWVYDRAFVVFMIFKYRELDLIS